ncbi:serine-type D-Ala-D-Ala carboxypeptidase [Cypionkella aquatica]|uniref:Serine-type D-Ala-D-Ala carboxypeptidase n=1 Tax=Cypionkella aquatica TaxID=1756042 RepID=A0AA37TXB3_9RHOB|nr:serine hydrolase [Cypionkella aquatica]GLS87510.1 serine-type D-Ala-D-Ala carboxypeptidase [Cypionkella aquatica]
MGNSTVCQLGQYVRHFVFLVAIGLLAACSSPKESKAAPYAAFVMDARTGETLYSENADTRLHPASLTKMMTLYITFSEIEAGNVSLDTMITVSKNAAAQPPSRLGLKAGQKIQLRYLIRAAAVKSANDAASAIGDYFEGTPEKWGARMTRTAKQLGMKNSTFKNANGLTAKGHLSTAHDMTIMGRHLFYDYPQYYNIFSRRSADAGIAKVANTNRKFLDAYKGADGIKTGYTGPAGFNLTGSAERNGVRIIATVFGGTSTPMRNQKMAELLDLGFRKAKPGGVAQPPVISADNELVAEADIGSQNSGTEMEVEGGGGPAKTLRVVMAVATSPRPNARPALGDAEPEIDLAAVDQVSATMAVDIAGALAEATAEPAPDSLEAQAVELAVAEAPPELSITAAAANPQSVQLIAAPAKPKRKAPIYDEVAVVAVVQEPVAAEEVVTNVSTSGGKGYGINIGRFNSYGEADRVLMKTLLSENATLGDALRKVVQKSGGFDANFLGLSQKEADLACRRLQARGVTCFTMGS